MAKAPRRIYAKKTTWPSGASGFVYDLAFRKRKPKGFKSLTTKKERKTVARQIKRERKYMREHGSRALGSRAMHGPRM